MPADDFGGGGGDLLMELGDTDDLIDEKTLLQAEDLKQPEKKLAAACSPVKQGEKKKRACKNCTCGLAEQQLDGGEQQAQPVKSSCGNVYAFWGKNKRVGILLLNRQ
jgi:hypothetical protein